MTGLDVYGEFGRFAPALATLSDLQTMTNYDKANLVWIMPPDVFVGTTRCYGIDVVRADVPEPIIGVRASR